MNELRKPPVGSRPGTLAIDPDSPAPRIRLTVYDDELHEVSEIDDVDALRSRLQSDGKLWVDVQGLGDEGVLRRLAEIFSIHPLALEDVAHGPIRPKTELYPDHLLVVTRMLRHRDAAKMETEQVSVFIGRNYVLTFQEYYGDVLDPVRARMEVPRSMMRRSGPDYLGYAIVDTIIDAYFPVVETIAEGLEGLEERVLAEARPEILRELNALKNTLLKVRRAVAPQREAINALIREDTPLVSDAVRIYLRDVYDHCVQTSEAVEIARELVNGLMNTYLSVVSNRMNEVMKTLTIVASIFVPLTFMAGVYGMNFQHMPELSRPWAYPVLLGLMGLVAAAMVVYFWRKGWIGGERHDSDDRAGAAST